MTTNPISLSKSVIAILDARKDALQWEKFIIGMLSKLELPEEKRAKAIQKYEDLQKHIAKKLHVDETSVHVVVQGSMKTQTTIAMYGNTKFDLDIVVKLSSPKYANLGESEQFFQDFGESLKGVDGAGEPSAKSRCWRLQYPHESFYFDVTPAIPTSHQFTGTELRVRDPETIWNPSNPEEFADWFCGIANKRFHFQEGVAVAKSMVLEDFKADPVPTEPIRIDDILRRTVQLLKLHRDNYYRGKPDERRAAMPISVILVTLAATAYDEMVTKEKQAFTSAIEVALEVADRLPKYIQYVTGIYSVMNPALPTSHGENFAERWNKDGGARKIEFYGWHTQLKKDLEALFSDEHTRRGEKNIQNVFGDHGVKAWRAGLHATGALGGLLGTLPAEPRSNPTRPIPAGSKDQLA